MRCAICRSDSLARSATAAHSLVVVAASLRPLRFVAWLTDFFFHLANDDSSCCGDVARESDMATAAGWRLGRLVEAVCAAPQCGRRSQWSAGRRRRRERSAANEQATRWTLKKHEIRTVLVSHRRLADGAAAEQ